ncbi:MAG: hypothetical protein AB1505_21545 [Candidatus Latescibacterota bacterium]
MPRAIPVLSLLALVAAGWGCAYRPYAGELQAMAEGEQIQGMAVADDGTVTHTQGRLEISLRPMTDEELNRQFGGGEGAEGEAQNPYTYGNTKLFVTQETPRRFTVMRLSVKNYEYPKVLLSGDIVITASNGRKYYDLSLDQLEVYLRGYAVAYAGNSYDRYSEQRDLLRRTVFPKSEVIFSGQEQEGYVLFEPLADDVADIEVTVRDVIVRFDYQGDPVEQVSTTYRFRRDVGRLYPDGRIELSSK